MNLAKLPKWAQDHINFLEMRLKEAQEELRSYVDLQEPSDVAIDRISNFEQPLLYLPKHSSIVFFLDNDHEKPMRLRKAIHLRRNNNSQNDSGHFHLALSTAGRGFPTIMPQAANCLRVHVTDEY